MKVVLLDSLQGHDDNEEHSEEDGSADNDECD